MAHAAPKLAPAATPETPQETPPKKNLSAALLEAQRLVGAVTKGSTNDFDRYQYVSADTMVAACRDALHEAGLLFFRDHFTVDRTVDPPELVSTFVLEYPATDERREYEIPWPIVGNPKRLYAVDKSRAGALTTALSYFLRDLLNVPREDKNEMDKREDRDEAVQAKPTDASKTLQAEAAGLISRLTDKRLVQTAGTYLERAGHELKLLRQLKGWLERRLEEQAAAQAGAEPKRDDAAKPNPDDPADDPESPGFGLEHDDGP